MSMLAERKVKQRWSLNPRGKDWSDDSSKFGQKMLEKMGWSKGKGLGAKENGIVEHVKIPYKNDSKGMGYKETNDQWTEHDTRVK
ncbi:PIN2/TERF1-interacting telomerase inhibitor 1-like Protein [Tribolium castaneum]|uniref:PIN2/TERF1-interacting telomerase inhibitor 1-like Protein n=1 Tax=Tribolium castaneum TaxID=7070 RepID=A0A139WA38_TRICA|nr:PIN2/TERF1-interacting telomerase inhibitor 1-like Protein [Tribolium castaneum]